MAACEGEMCRFLVIARRDNQVTLTPESGAARLIQKKDLSRRRFLRRHRPGVAVPNPARKTSFSPGSAIKTLLMAGVL
jgi:hypothetical protein